MHMFHMRHTYDICSPYIHAKYLAYMPNVVGVFVYGIYLAKTGEVKVAVGCVLVIYAKCWIHMTIYDVGWVKYILNVVAIFAKLHMEDICTMLFVTWLMPVTSYEMYVHTSPIYACQVFGM